VRERALTIASERLREWVNDMLPAKPPAGSPSRPFAAASPLEALCAAHERFDCGKLKQPKARRFCQRIEAAGAKLCPGGMEEVHRSCVAALTEAEGPQFCAAAGEAVRTLLESATVAAHLPAQSVEKVMPLWDSACQAEQQRLKAAGPEAVCKEAETMLVKAVLKRE